MNLEEWPAGWLACSAACWCVRGASGCAALLTVREPTVAWCGRGLTAHASATSVVTSQMTSQARVLQDGSCEAVRQHNALQLLWALAWHGMACVASAACVLTCLPPAACPLSCSSSKFATIQGSCTGAASLAPYGVDPVFKRGTSSYDPDLDDADGAIVTQYYNCSEVRRWCCACYLGW